MQVGFSDDRGLAETLVSQNQRDAMLAKWQGGLTAVFCRNDDRARIKKKLKAAGLITQNQAVQVSENVCYLLVHSTSQTAIRGALMQEEE